LTGFGQAVLRNSFQSPNPYFSLLNIALNSEEKDAVLDNINAKDTKRQTHTAVKLFRGYLTEKNMDLDFENLCPLWEGNDSLQQDQAFSVLYPYTEKPCSTL
jgi:hypothetical protein